MKKVRILSIDGGGIRGILPGVILNEIERKLKKESGNEDARLSDYFDFFAGTSTGGILSLAYIIPNENKKARYSAKDAVNLYLERGDEIFDIGFWQKISSVGGIIDEKYQADNLEEALQDNFGEIYLSDLIKPCIITSYDIRNGKPHFFKQHKSSNDIFNFKVKDVARATSAAPTYFETARVKNISGSPFPLIDGGVFVNNPAMVAYSEARTMSFGEIEKPAAKDMMIVSIGTGSTSKQYAYKSAKDWGQAQWVKPLIEIMMSASSQTVHYHLKQIFDTLSNDLKNNYYRIEPKVIRADVEMDNASVENMQKLEEDALSFISNEDNDQQLNEIVKKLINYS